MRSWRHPKNPAISCNALGVAAKRSTKSSSIVCGVLGAFGTPWTTPEHRTAAAGAQRRGASWQLFAARGNHFLDGQKNCPWPLAWSVMSPRVFLRCRNYFRNVLGVVSSWPPLPELDSPAKPVFSACGASGLASAAGPCSQQAAASKIHENTISAFSST